MTATRLAAILAADYARLIGEDEAGAVRASVAAFDYRDLRSGPRWPLQRRVQSAALRKYRPFADGLVNGSIDLKPPLGPASARSHPIGRRAAQVVLVLLCMTRKGAPCPKPGKLRRS